MRREQFRPHEHVGSGRVGLAVADMQTLHRGHENLLNEMRRTCDVCIVGLGSTKQKGVLGHPFDFDQRKAMIQGLYGDAFRFVPLDDIDAVTDRRDWYAYVQRKIRGAGLPDPTDYFGGSSIDASWYVHAFADERMPSQKRVLTTTYEHPATGKRLHVVDRDAADIPSGREIRQLIEFRDPKWRLYVAERLHRFVEMEYPPHLRQPIDFQSDVADRAYARDIHSSLFRFPPGHTVSSLLDYWRAGTALPTTDTSLNALDFLMASLEGEYPVGTRMIEKGSGEVLELKDDGKWRRLRGEDEKTRWALDKQGR